MEKVENEGGIVGYTKGNDSEIRRQAGVIILLQKEKAEQAKQIADLTGRLHDSHSVSLSRRKEIVRLVEQTARLKEGINKIISALKGIIRC